MDSHAGHFGCSRTGTAAGEVLRCLGDRDVLSWGDPMFDAMNVAQLAEQHVELLPARTVLSVTHAGIDGTAGDPGAAGTPGANGQSYSGTSMWALITGYNQTDSGRSVGDASSKSG